MESLYTKYRPQTFEQIVGQTHVVETLKRAVLEGRTSHAYLFCGPRGTGKTTMARILAKALMCEKGPGALPDGTCDQCQLIAAGEHPDVIELDAASRTGVDNVREEIISRVNYAPTRGRCKVYIIDEVHMLTTAAFNALLKTLEEPPEHVVFIMCTTDPQKILATILSRVQRFDFHAIAANEMQAHLAYVCSQEGFTYDDAALELIVRHARGGMRDALTSLEQLSVFGAGNVSLAAATDFLGEVSGSVLGQVSRALAHRDVAALFAEVGELVDAGRDLLQFTRELAAHVRDVYVVAAVPSAEDVVSATGAELDALRAEAAAFGSVDRLSRALTILGDASNEMRTATNQRLVLEIAFTRMARPETDLTLASLAERVADLERQVAVLSVPGAVAPVAAAPAKTPTAEKPVQPVEMPRPVPEPAPAPKPVTTSTSAPAPTKKVTAPAPSQSASSARPGANPAASRAASEPQGERRAGGVGPRPGGASLGTDAAALQRQWKQVVDTLVAKVPAKGSLLLSSTAVSDDGEKLTVSLPKGSRFAARMLERSDVRESIDPVVANIFGRRQLVYVESSLAAQSISRAEKPAPQRPAVAPTPSPTQPQPAPQPATTPAPAPVAAPSSDYPMPWDAPASAPVSASDDDQPPYNDVVLTPEDDPYSPVPSTPAIPAANSATSPESPVTAAQPLGGYPAASHEVSEPQGERRAGGVTPEGPGGQAETPDALTPEFADIASMLAEAFGQPVSVSVESAVTTSDDEAASELSADAAPDDGFTDEPADDADD